MKIVFVSPNRLLHNQWNKAIDNHIEILNIFSQQQLDEVSIVESDIVIFDYDNCAEFLSDLLTSKVVCLSSELDNVLGFRLLKQGVKAYGNNYMTPMNLKEVIKVVGLNKIWVHPELMSFIIENSTLTSLPKHDDKINELSTRELDVSKLVSQGFTNKQIANELDITERTVKAHISAVFSKFEIKDRVTLGIMIKEYLNS